MDPKPSSPYLIPASIIVAGVLVAGAVIYTRSTPEPSPASLENALSKVAKNIRPVSGQDHLLGNPEAAVKIVEFSDLECPFCKSFHPTLKMILEEYGKDGRVAWVYRHFPLDSIHPKARKEAEAAECAAELGGNTSFWAYLDRLFEVTPSNNRLDPELLPQLAKDVGLDEAKFKSCLDSGKYAKRVAEDLQDAINSGGDGTPYSVIITKKGEVFPFAGALPYQQVKALVDQALSTI